MKNFFSTWFSFSRKELNGLFVLMLICFIAILSGLAFPHLFSSPPSDFSSFRKEIEEFEANQNNKEQPQYSDGKLKHGKENNRNIKLASFDPNTILYEEWLQLGLSEKQANVVTHYLEKGGRFRKKEDLRKIYSISKAQYELLEPYIVIGIQENPQSRLTRSESHIPVNRVVELNEADSSQLVLIKGIGPVFARRIIKYRDRIGGFCRKEQLKEVYGIDSLVYLSIERNISVDISKIKLTNINIASFNDLKRYPYLSNKQINALLNYRKQHGLFSSVDDVKKANIIDEEALSRIIPYLSID